MHVCIQTVLARRVRGTLPRTPCQRPVRPRAPKGAQVTSAFVVDLFAEASRNSRVAELVRDVCDTTMDWVTDLIARAPETKSLKHDLTSRQIAELIFAVNDGMLMRAVLDVSSASDEERRERQLKVVRSLWRLLFKTESEPAYA